MFRSVDFMDQEDALPEIYEFYEGEQFQNSELKVAEKWLNTITIISIRLYTHCITYDSVICHDTQ